MRRCTTDYRMVAVQGSRYVPTPLIFTAYFITFSSKYTYQHHYLCSRNVLTHNLLHRLHYGFHMILTVNHVNQLICVMVKCGVLFEVRTGFSQVHTVASYCVSTQLELRTG
jgi:hypothetical protein